MGISALMTKACKQTCVYWASPVKDGYGGETFTDPVELSCRWEDKVTLLKKTDGTEISASSVVYVLQDLSDEGWLFLGELTDLESDTENPKTVDGARQIIRFDKSPDMLGVDYVRKAYL